MDYHHTNSVYDFVLDRMFISQPKEHRPERSFKQRLQFRLIARQYQRPPQWRKAS